MEKSVITVIGRLIQQVEAAPCNHEHNGCSGHDHSSGCSGHDHSECEGKNHSRNDHGSCESCGHHKHVYTDMQQFNMLKDFIEHVDMQDEIRLQFMNWDEGKVASYPNIAELLDKGYELPMVAINDSIRLAGAIRPEKVIHLLNEMRANAENGN